LLLTTPSAGAIEAVASVKNLKGDVEIQRNNVTISARTGLILHDKDLVVTYQQSRITIEFRDGSVIRLFPNTKFLIEKSEEATEGPRRFLNNFRLKLGSFWGKFTRHYQETAIYTPTATVGIKGTTVAMSERNDSLVVSLSSGKVQIANQSETIELLPGQIARKITRLEPIKDKIEALPYQILIKPDKDRVSIPKKGEAAELYFTLQLIDLRTNKNAERAGDVYISVASDYLIFDQDIRLNPRGYARIKAFVKSPDKVDHIMDQVEIFALMDGEEYLDVRAGSTLLKLDYPKEQNQKLKIDASSGDVKP
jgi:hypothetical protein